MSGMMCALLGSHTPHVYSSLNFSASNIAAGTGSSTATVTFYADGSENGTTTGASAWFSDITANIGASYWISTDAGAWVSMSTTQSWSLTGTNATASHTIRVASDSAGTNIVGSGTLSLSVTNGA